MTEPRRFVFAPLERRGAVAGLRTGQLVVLAAGLVGGVGLLRARPSALGILPAVGVVGLSVACAFVEIAGRPTEQWAPVVGRFATRRVAGRHRTRPRAPSAGRVPVRIPRSLASLTFDDIRSDAAEQAIGVVTDRRTGISVAVLETRGRSFALLDRADQERRLSAWANVLAAMAREGGPVARLQWLQRAVDGDADALVRHFDRRQAGQTGPAVRSYADLLADAGRLTRDHDCYVTIAVRRGTTHAVLEREVRLLHGQLRHAEIDVLGVLTARQLSGVVRTAFDPAARSVLSARASAWPDRSGSATAAAWPSATETHWDAYRTDDAWHATFWIAEWPRTEVGPDFLIPLLLGGRGTRATSLVMAPASPSEGFREAEAARTAATADDELRRRAGFLATARRRRETDSLARRESELADGHAAYRFGGYLTVSAATRETLEETCSETLQLAHQCRLDLRRLTGMQDEAFTWTLPLARGLA